MYECSYCHQKIAYVNLLSVDSNHSKPACPTCRLQQ